MTIKRAPANGEPRYRVLVVDDDAWMARVIEAVLSPEMDVVTCPSGELAVRVLQNEDFHVLCADYKMPGMSGIELLARAKMIREHIGRLLVTGADAQLLSDDRRDHYVLTKPFDPGRLLGVVKQLARIAEMKRSVDEGSRTSAPPSSRQPALPPSSRRPTQPPSSRPSTPPSSSRISSLPSIPSAPAAFDRGKRR